MFINRKFGLNSFGFLFLPYPFLFGRPQSSYISFIIFYSFCINFVIFASQRIIYFSHNIKYHNGKYDLFRLSLQCKLIPFSVPAFYTSNHIRTRSNMHSIPFAIVTPFQKSYLVLFHNFVCFCLNKTEFTV